MAATRYKPRRGTSIRSRPTSSAPAPFPLRFVRTYNSDRIPDRAPGPIGSAWTHTYYRHIVGYPSSGSPPVDTAVVYRDDGRILKFHLTGGIWQPDADVSERLFSQTQSVIGETIIVGWTFIANDDSVETYDGEGRLMSITDRAGFTQTLSYADASNHPKDDVQSVTDPQGRKITFGYNGSGQITSLTDGNGNEIDYGYDGNNNLQTVTYPDQGGGTTTRTYFYNESGQTGGVSQPHALTGIQDENSDRYVSWGYDSQGRGVLSVHGPYSGGTIDRTSLAFNNDGTTSVTDALSQSRTFTFSVQYLVARYTDLDTPCDYCGSKFTSRSYDSNGYPSSGTDFRGYTTGFTYDSRGLETQSDEATGEPEERITNTTWDADHRVPTQRTVVNHSGTTEQRTDWKYNERGQPIARCEYTDPASSYACTETGTPPDGVRRWVYTYCNGSDLTTPDPIGSVGEDLSKGCPFTGLIRRIDGPRTDVEDWTTYEYYLSTDTGTPPVYRTGDLSQVVDALGHTTQYLAYDGNGRPTLVQDANGVSTNLAYHPRGWLHIRTVCANTDCSPSVNDATTQTDYDGVGNVIKVTQPDGVYLSYTYDNAHRLTNITDNLGDHIDYTLDDLGHRTAEKTYDVSDAVNPRRLLTRSYNALARMTDQYDAQSRDTHFTYDDNGNRTDETDPLGVKTHWDYDGLNRLADQVGDYQGTDPSTMDATTGYEYDTRDNITGITDPNNLATGYTFDDLNNLTQLDSPDTGMTQYPDYDAAGNRLTQTDNRGVTQTMTYDALNRLSTITYPESSLDVAYTYDNYPDGSPCAQTSYPLGRLTGFSDHSGSTSYCYDLRGNIIEKIQVTGLYRFDTRYSCNLADRLISITYPSGALVSYTRDNNGRIDSVSVTPPGGTATSVVTNITWEPFGPPMDYTFAQGSQSLTKSFDQNYWMTDVTGSALDLHFCRDAESNITSLAATSPACMATPTQQYQYDNLYRLTHVQDGSGNNLQDFAYNLTGDRLSKTLDPSPVENYSYTPNTHQLVQVGSNNRMLDANGNTTEITGTATLDFTFDDRNRMTDVSRDTTPITIYDYNAKGERVYKDTTYPASDTRWFDYAESGGMLGEYTATSEQEYVWADNTPVAILTTTGQSLTVADRVFANGFETPITPATTIDYIHSDQLDTPRVVTTTAGATQWNWPWQTNPFGETTPTGSLALNLRFPGQYFDAETALNYNYFRDYEPGTGRYVESDPVGLVGGVDIYDYALNQSFLLHDLHGLAPCGKDCCKNQNFNGAEAVTKCCGDKAITCTNPHICDPWGGDNSEFCHILKKCTAAHEKLHREKHFDCSQNPPFDPSNKNKFECEAWSLTLRCLSTPCESRTCAGRKHAYINGDTTHPGAYRTKKMFCRAAQAPSQ